MRDRGLWLTVLGVGAAATVFSFAYEYGLRAFANRSPAFGAFLFHNWPLIGWGLPLLVCIAAALILTPAFGSRLFARGVIAFAVSAIAVFVSMALWAAACPLVLECV
jgi:hypothetical protein